MMTPLFFFAAGACQSISGTDCTTGLPHGQATAANLNHLLTVLFGILGAIAVLMILIGAFNFVPSEGDPQKAARARSTMIYALIGLAVAISAEAIITFVLGKF